MYTYITSYIYIYIYIYTHTQQVDFEDDLAMTSMYSGEGEKIVWDKSVYPEGNVEFWLTEVCMPLGLFLPFVVCMYTHRLEHSITHVHR